MLPFVVSITILLTPVHLFAAEMADPEMRLVAVASPNVDAETTLPKVWIGVRVTPVPAPLGAHVGTEGVMIVNVVKDGPADRAGLQQYDIITQYNGQTMATMEDLTDAIGTTPPDSSARILIVREAKKHQLKIAPTRRNQAPETLIWKYAEPEADALVDRVVKMRGLALDQGPGGEWTIKHLGPLEGIPEALQELKELHSFQWNTDDEPFAIRLDPNTLEDSFGKLNKTFVFRNDNAEQTNVTVRVEEDGRRVVVTRDEQGQITVTRTDADGNESESLFPDIDTLQEADPEAYELLSPHLEGISHVMITQPEGAQADQLRKQYQITVREHLDEALDRLRDMEHDIIIQQQQALERTNEAADNARRRIKILTTPPPTLQPPAAESLGIRLHADGSVTAYVYGATGDVERLRFDSVASLQAAEPELYDRYAEVFEDVD